MPLTWLLLILIGVALVALIIQGARRQLAAAARDEADETAGDGPMFGIEATGGAVAEIPREDRRHLNESWHPVRLPPVRDGGGDLMEKRRTWLRDQAQGIWRVEGRHEGGTVFWFQNAADARAFTDAWFPVKSG